MVNRSPQGESYVSDSSQWSPLLELVEPRKIPSEYDQDPLKAPVKYSLYNKKQKQPKTLL